MPSGIYKHKKGKEAPNFGKYKYNITKEFLIKEYTKKEKIISQIAKEIGCGYEMIRRNLIKYNILIRTRSEVKKGNKYGLKDGRSIKQHYCLEKDCNNEICYENWLYGSRRCKFCALKGERSGFYIDGLGKEPYPLEWTDTLKESIRQRDNHTCQKCNKKQYELKGRFKKLDIHHIDYNKENCNKNNLITLHRSCNSKVNFNRDYWFAYFTYIMEEYYVR